MPVSTQRLVRRQHERSLHRAEELVAGIDARLHRGWYFLRRLVRLGLQHGPAAVQSASPRVLRQIWQWLFLDMDKGLHQLADVTAQETRQTVLALLKDHPGRKRFLREDEEDPLTALAQWSWDQLFPPPTRGEIRNVVLATGWRQRLESMTRLASPDVLSSILLSGLAQGKTRQELINDLLPHVENVRSTARRIARTEGMRVAGAMQQRSYDQLGDLVIGYQVHATLDKNTRPWHRARDGTIYWLDPKPGQKGMAQLPHPPDEPVDPRERPPGTPQTSFNCRCWLTPILRT